MLPVQDVRNSMILPTRAKIRSHNEPWQLLNGNSVWANGQEERSHNALISDNNLHGSTSCTFSQITRKQQVPVFSVSLATTLLEWLHHLLIDVTTADQGDGAGNNPYSRKQSLVGVILVGRQEALSL